MPSVLRLRREGPLVAYLGVGKYVDQERPRRAAAQTRQPDDADKHTDDGQLGLANLLFLGVGESNQEIEDRVGLLGGAHVDEYLVRHSRTVRWRCWANILLPTTRGAYRLTFSHECGFARLGDSSPRLPALVTRMPRHREQLADLPQYGRDLACRGQGTLS